MRLTTWLSKPWLHFVVVGVVLFWLQGVFFPQPKPIVGPLGKARLDALEQQWFASVGSLPSEAQTLRMIQAELNRDMLFQRALDLELHLLDTVVYQRLLRNMQFLQLSAGKTEQEVYKQALTMRLHLGDEVVKRRMIQVMEQLLLANGPPLAVTEKEILTAFTDRRQELRRKPRYSIEHVYFSNADQAIIAQVIEAIDAGGLSAAQALQYSAPFLTGYRFERQTPDQLARVFGAEFVKDFQRSQPVAGRWLGPLRSTYGLHYVWVNAIEKSREAYLAEVRKLLQRDIAASKRAAALEAGIAALRERYEVVL